MKTIICFFILSNTCFAQQPTIKFYLEDGTVKEYNIYEIDSMSVSRDNLYVMHIYFQDSIIAYYPNEIIQSIKIEEVSQQGRYLSVNIFGFPKHYFVFDIDSIIFKIDKWQPLTIGTQVWMLKNLNVDYFRNGDFIGDGYFYSNDSSTYSKYGKLYNWYNVSDTRELAPAGWHIPTKAEWDSLIKFLGGTANAGARLKGKGTIENGDGLWLSPNTGATNESGFTALPGGSRDDNGNFGGIGTYGDWWTATDYSSTHAMNRNIYYSNESVSNYSNKKGFYLSVRCIKD
jgi:uncharacterized protein (TIGR02145 family)